WSDLCLIILDIDFFKQINDQHGHIAGDHVIQAVARQLMAHESKFDLVVRYGGDEFLLLIERIARNDALDVAEMIRAQIEVISIELQIDVSVSMGVAVGAENWLTLFQKADTALLQSKAKGKNRVEAALS
ncbi:GGDEF domain-containing protein, partial [uncultured Acinetobacter sp.]